MVRSLVAGVGVNDSKDITARHERDAITGKRRVIWKCPYYSTWKSMLERCYSEKLHKRLPKYADCFVVDEWHLFSNFKTWMVQQDWEGMHLDKDLLVFGNKVYSPETCVFIERRINSFITETDSIRGEWPIGVCWHKQKKKFYASVRLDSGKQKHLGSFDCPTEAHHAWIYAKLELAKKLALAIENPIVADALVKRYENYAATATRAKPSSRAPK